LQEKTDSAAVFAQEKLNADWDLIFELPVYRTLLLDMVPISSGQPAEQGTSSEKSLRTFRGQVNGMLTAYFEPLSRRSSEAYAEAYASYFTDMVDAGCLFFPEQDFEQNFPEQICFVPMAHPTKKRTVILAEKAEFRYLTHFLHTDFYRGLMAGNAPRRCHNCGRYFLLTKGCNNIAPGETERTCRKVGAHRKEAQGKANRTPVQKEYDRTYNRLKQRKVRGKISTDEWNAAVEKAQKLVEQSERGELTDEELKQRLAEL